MAFTYNRHWLLATAHEKLAKHGNMNDAIPCLKHQIDTKRHDVILEHSNWFHNLGNLLAQKYQRTGEIPESRSTILPAERGFDVIPCDHPHQREHPSDRGGIYERSRANEDLESALLQFMKVLRLTPLYHTCQESRLNNFGNWIAKKYERAGNFTDLENAIRRADEALAITPCHHPDRASYLNSLGIMLAPKYWHHVEQADVPLDVLPVAAVPRLTPACSPEHRNRPSLELMAYRKLESAVFPHDLDYAICLAEKTLAKTPTGSPNEALVLLIRGDLLYCRYGQPHATEDQKWRDYTNCVSDYKRVWNSQKSPHSVRIRAAQKAAKILLRLGKYEESNTLLQGAVQLLPSISLHSLNPQDQQYVFGEFTGLATLAASTALEVRKEPVRALQLLEQGRAISARLRLGIQTALATLKLQQPEKAEKLKCSITFLGTLDCSLYLDSSASGNDVAIHRQETSQRSRAADTICKIPGFETFLLPPPSGEFQAAASGGPVVVLNASPVRCDALLIQTDSIRLLPLPNLDYNAMKRMVDLFKAVRVPIKPFCNQNEMCEILEWLWDAVASPILNELGFREAPREGDAWPRVWWIPTGLLSMLPIHAAGRHGSSGSETVIDRVISSYSLSVRVLLCTRGRTAGYSRVRGEVCVASMMTTPGCSPLPTVGEETEAIEALLPSLQVGPARLLHNPRKAEVIEGLKTCDIFHFAGHGVLNPVDPSKSRLLLNDWKEDPLTVESIMDLNLGGNTPFLAYLSACSTGAGPAECLQDESINLMTAFQLAGVRHAVGSLWNLFKKYPAIAALQFYKALGNGKAIDDNAVASAVHATARHIREITRNPEDSNHEAGDLLAWAAYIHIGP